MSVLGGNDQSRQIVPDMAAIMGKIRHQQQLSAPLGHCRIYSQRQLQRTKGEQSRPRRQSGNGLELGRHRHEGLARRL